MSTGFRIINNSEVFGLLARVSHGSINVVGFTLRAQQGHQDTEYWATVGQRGIYFYDDFTHAVVGNIEVTLEEGQNTSITLTGSPGNLLPAIGIWGSSDE